MHSVPRMFQLWACKQVWDIAGTNYPRSKWDGTVKKWCPSCRRAKETCAHVSQCREKGRIQTLQATIGFLDTWLEKVGTDPDLRRCIIQFARGHGYKSMEEVCGVERLKVMAREQDKIGWRRFMEGMISKQMLCLQEEYHVLTGEGPSTRKWAAQLVCRLLEVVHGQWVYRNIQVHDKQQGVLRTEEKEHLLREIEIEMALGFHGFLEMDASLATVTLEDMESSGGGIRNTGF